MKNSCSGPKLTLQQILNQHLDELSQKGIFNSYELKILSALRKCRTSELGGHYEACDKCAAIKVHYNSCGNRHCPGCQGANRERWLLEREHDLFDAAYHHVTFTVPAELRVWFKVNKKELYNLLFASMWQTLLSFSNDKRSRLEAQIGVISILHTWTQKLEYHPHLHCIVPSGGLTKAKGWKHKSGKFLFYVSNVSKVFRTKFCKGFKELYKDQKLEDPKGFNGLDFDLFLDSLHRKEWVVNSKPGFKAKESVLEYLGRYTHKIAISNYRLISLNDGWVRFTYRDRKAGDIKRIMELPIEKFLLRFVQHILPVYFVKIRHYGIFSTRIKKEKLSQIRKSLNQPPPKKRAKLILAEVILKTTGKDITKCSCCNQGTMRAFQIIHPVRGSPGNLSKHKPNYV